MGQDYCICQGIFNKEQESHLLSSKRGLNENSRKKIQSLIKKILQKKKLQRIAKIIIN